MIQYPLAMLVFGGSFLLFLTLLFLINKWKPEREENEKKRKKKKLIKSFLLFIVIWWLGGFLMRPVTENIILDKLLVSFYIVLTGNKPTTPIPHFLYEFSLIAFLVGLLVAIKDFKKKKWPWVFLMFLLISFFLIFLSSIIR